MSLASLNTAPGAHKATRGFPCCRQSDESLVVLSLWAAGAQSCATAWLAAGLKTAKAFHQKLQQGFSHCSRGMGSFSTQENHADTAPVPLSPSTDCLCWLGLWNCCWAIGPWSQKSRNRPFCWRLFARVGRERGKKNRPNNAAEPLHTKPLPGPWCRLQGTSVHLESSRVWLWFSNNQLWV